ncbi:MAG: hypothetical protein RI897_4116 [Verrucomicrobiota bacterium]
MDHLLGFLAEGLSGLGVFEQVLNLVEELLLVLNLGDGVVGKEFAGDEAEIFHMGAGEDGFSEGGGFDGVLASVGGEAFTDEDEGGAGVEGF